jgi:hypothetical protein
MQGGDVNLLISIDLLLSQMDPFSSVALDSTVLHSEACRQMREVIGCILKTAGMAPKPFSLTGKNWQHPTSARPSPLNADVISNVTELFLSFPKLEESWAAIIIMLDLPLVSSEVCLVAHTRQQPLNGSSISTSRPLESQLALGSA